MKQRRLTLLTGTILALFSLPLAAHDDKIHKATVGLVAAATKDGLDLNTKTGMVKVKYSSKTTFELDNKPAERKNVRVGDRVGVLGSKLPSGDLMANEVILGVPEQKPAKATAEKKSEHKH
jgi:hypothetical protein